MVVESTAITDKNGFKKMSVGLEKQNIFYFFLIWEKTITIKEMPKNQLRVT